MRKLLIVIPNLGAGGAQNVFRDQVRFYSTHFEVIPVTFNTDGFFADDHTLHVRSLDVPAGDNAFSKLLNFLKRVSRLRDIKRDYNIAYSISHLEGADYVNILSAGREKTICWIHGTKKHDKNISGVSGWIRKALLMPWLYKKADRIVTVSGGIHEELLHDVGIDPSRIRTIPNGFDIPTITGKASESHSFPVEQLKHTASVLVTHCRLAHQKNLELMLEIFSVMRKNHKVKLIIAGDGELRESLMKRAQDWGFNTYASWRNDVVNDSYDLYFVGHQSNPYSLISKGDVYLMTSSWEGFPLSLGEAMICSVPVVSTDCFTGPRELIAPGLSIPQPILKPYHGDYGVLMPINADNKMWIAEIKNLLDDENKRKELAHNAKLRMNELGRESVWKQWMTLIDG